MDGVHWAVAVSGPTLVAVKGKASYPLADVEAVHKFLRWATPDQAETVSLSVLKEWAGLSEPFRRTALIKGQVFDPARVARLLVPVPFPKLLMSVTFFDDTPTLVLDAPGRWRAFLAGMDTEPDADSPVWGKTTESRIFDLAMSLE